MTEMREARRHLLRRTGAALLAFAAAARPLHAVGQAASLDRLREIHRMVMDPGGQYSISATLAELDALEQRLPSGEPDSAARGELNYLRGFVQYRAGRPALSLPPSIEASRIDAAAPFLTGRERARLAYNIAAQAETLQRWDVAIDAYRRASALFETEQETTEDQKAGTLERLAYCLHEAQRYGEAKAVNETVLATGERLFGPGSDKLLIVLTNLAQNSYKLGDLPASRGFLERRLAVATTHDRASHVDDSLFQLGVLAFEQGQKAEADRLMTRRLALAEANGDAERIAAAKADLDVLREKIGR